MISEFLTVFPHMALNPTLILSSLNWHYPAINTELEMLQEENRSNLRGREFDSHLEA